MKGGGAAPPPVLLVIDQAPTQRGEGNPWTLETTVPWSTLALSVGDGVITRPAGMLREPVAVARADEVLVWFSMLNPPQLERSELVTIDVAPLPDQLALTVSGN